MRAKIVVTNWVHDEVLALLAAHGEVDANRSREPWPEAEVRRRAGDAAALLAFMTDRVDAAFLALCPKLRVVAGALKGFDNFDVDACTQAGVWLTIVPDLLTAPTAEFAIGLAIALGRRILEGDRIVRDGRFAGWRPWLYGGGIDGSTAGIVGLGAVGRAIARRLSGFEARILGYDPVPPAAAGGERIERVDLDRLLRESDLVFVAAPLTPASRHMIGADALARLRPGSRLVNVGRGSVVDEEAVAAALAERRLAGYAADVYGFEDWALRDRPRAIPAALLAETERTVLTPHIGSAVDDVRRAIALAAARDIVAVLEGRVPAGAVNRPWIRPPAG